MGHTGSNKQPTRQYGATQTIATPQAYGILLLLFLFLSFFFRKCSFVVVLNLHFPNGGLVCLSHLHPSAGQVFQVQLFVLQLVHFTFLCCVRGCFDWFGTEVVVGVGVPIGCLFLGTSLRTYGAAPLLFVGCWFVLFCFVLLTTISKLQKKEGRKERKVNGREDAKLGIRMNPH